METGNGTTWQGIPTALDRTFFPSITIAGGGFGGNISFVISGAPAFILNFRNFEVISAYEETPYWTLAETNDRPLHTLNLIVDTPLVLRLRDLLHKPSLSHFLLCGGDMCAEVVADAYAIEEFARTENEEAICAGRMTRKLEDICYSEWITP